MNKVPQKHTQLHIRPFMMAYIGWLDRSSVCLYKFRSKLVNSVLLKKIFIIKVNDDMFRTTSVYK